MPGDGLGGGDRTGIHRGTDRLPQGAGGCTSAWLSRWTLAELAQHVGRVQRWATAILSGSVPIGHADVEQPPSDPHRAAEYFASATPPMLEALRRRVEGKVWNFTGEDLTLDFWKRRQPLRSRSIGMTRRLPSSPSPPAPTTRLTPGVAVATIDELLRVLADLIVGEA